MLLFNLILITVMACYMAFPPVTYKNFKESKTQPPG